MPKYAHSLGGPVYVVTTTTIGSQPHESMVTAANLAEAKSRHGYTRQLHTYRRVRRATWEDVERLGGLGRVRERL